MLPSSPRITNLAQSALWVFYIFGAFLVYTALKLARDVEHDADVENAVVRFARSRVNMTDRWDGLRLYVKEGPDRLMTPMFLVILALGATDLISPSIQFPPSTGSPASRIWWWLPTCSR